MSRYKKKFEPTKDGFQEVWDSMQDPTIEQLMAGIQAHRPTTNTWGRFFPERP